MKKYNCGAVYYSCPNCNYGRCETGWKEQRVDFLKENSPDHMIVRVPVKKCYRCGLEFLNFEAEDIIKREMEKPLVADIKVDLEHEALIMNLTDKCYRRTQRKTVLFSEFETSGDGIEPDFTDVEVVDDGQTLRLGEYEAAVDSLI